MPVLTCALYLLALLMLGTGMILLAIGGAWIVGANPDGYVGPNATALVMRDARLVALALWLGPILAVAGALLLIRVAL